MKNPLEILNDVGDVVEDDLKHFQEIPLDRSLNYLFIVLLGLLTIMLVVSLNSTTMVIALMPEVAMNNARTLCGYTGNFTQIVSPRDWSRVINSSGGWNWTTT